MTSLRQIEANRRNALHSTGPRTQSGKNRSRRNAIRHGLCAETVITAIEDIDDYRDFEKAVIADYDATTAVERELTLRVASLLWRLRRASSIETGLFQVQTELSLEKDRMSQAAAGVEGLPSAMTARSQTDPQCEITSCFLLLANADGQALASISRYEAALWRQLRQTLFTLQRLSRRRRETPRARSKPTWCTPMKDSNFGGDPCGAE
jgi:hypothetical protein